MVDTFEDRHGSGAWMPEWFMNKVQYMISTQFWEGVRGEYVVVIQDNGVPTRRWDSAEARIITEAIFKYGYAGSALEPG